MGGLDGWMGWRTGWMDGVEYAHLRGGDGRCGFWGDEREGGREMAWGERGDGGK